MKRLLMMLVRSLFRNIKVTFIYILCVAIFSKVLLHFSSLNNLSENHFENVLLWWTPFTLEQGRTLDCSGIQCHFTNNKSFLKSPSLKAILFYGTRVNVSKLPLPKALPWALLHEESPRNNPLLVQSPILTLFNFSSTFSRMSHMPLTLQFLPSISSLKDKKFFVPVERKNKAIIEEGLAPVVYLQSDCSTPNNRDSYVLELMKYIPVDSYGNCLHNKDLPHHLTDSMTTMMSEELLNFLSIYKFAIAFENAVCDDYITEKLWRPLMIGVIPIYFGSPTVNDWLPNRKSAVLVSEFSSPKELADFLMLLNANSNLYDEYMSHKLALNVDNNRLLENVKEDNDYIQTGSFIGEFECLVCEKVVSGEIGSVAREHYNCDHPKSMLTKDINSTNWWHEEWKLEQCRAQKARDYIDSGQNPPYFLHC